MKWKNLGKALFFPNKALFLLILPISVYLFGYSMLNLSENNPMRIASYVLSAYTLTVSCIRIPKIICFFDRIKNENRYAQRWLSDTRLRMNITLTANTMWNGVYAILQLGLGIYHKSFWFYALFGYYFSLSVMRLTLVRHMAHHKPGEKMLGELRRYRSCGSAFLLTNLALSAMIFYMIYDNRLVRHHEITTIALATYTFASLTLAIINVVKYKKYNSPVISASKAISLAAACVSMLTLEGTMLTTFGGETMTPQAQRLFLALSGGTISIFILTMSIYMIVNANRRIKRIEKLEQ